MPATIEQFEPFIDDVLAAPSDVGTVELVVCRPAVGERRVLEAAELVPGRGLVGDNYVERGSTRTPDGLADPLAELNVMSAHALRAVAGPDRERWQLAGDQLIVDFDLSADNLPAGTRLRIGTAVIEVTDEAPHRLRQVLRAIRSRGGPLGQLPQGPPPARDLRRSSSSPARSRPAIHRQDRLKALGGSSRDG